MFLTASASAILWLTAKRAPRRVASESALCVQSRRENSSTPKVAVRKTSAPMVNSTRAAPRSLLLDLFTRIMSAASCPCCRRRRGREDPHRRARADVAPQRERPVADEPAEVEDRLVLEAVDLHLDALVVAA